MMSKRIEVEKKFFCEHVEKLVDKLKTYNFKASMPENEIDEYFTDINSKYIKNRTCLRIRKKDDHYAELTFKGKSQELNNLYIKEESNIEIKPSEYAEMVRMLHSLGYLSYTVVDKSRITYSKTENDLTFNVMIDNIKEIGSFAEFEILASIDSYSVNSLEEKLNDFIDKFDGTHLSEADVPYRDFVANKIYTQIRSANKLEALLLDLDGTLINSENIFQKSFSKIIEDQFGYKVSAKEYKVNELDRNNNLINYLRELGIISKKISDSSIMSRVYENYQAGFIELLSKDDTIINFELIKLLKAKGLKLALVTTSKREYVDILIKTLNVEKLFDSIICREDVTVLKPGAEAYLKALQELKVDNKSAIAVEDSRRGLIAAQEAKIKTIQISNESNSDITIDKFSRLALILLNQ